MSIFNTSINDIDDLVICHKKAFPNSLSSMLGNKYLKKMLEWYIVSKRGIIFHIKKNNMIVGYCAGVFTNSKKQLGASSSINQYTFSIILFSLFLKPWLLLHHDIKKKIPYALKAILIKLRISDSGVKMQNHNKTNFKPYLGLISIGIDSSYQRQGLGSLLLNEFELKAKNCYKVEKIILSVNNENKKAINAYLKNNWKVEYVGKLNSTLIKKI